MKQNDTETENNIQKEQNIARKVMHLVHYVYLDYANHLKSNLDDYRNQLFDDVDFV